MRKTNQFICESYQWFRIKLIWLLYFLIQYCYKKGLSNNQNYQSLGKNYQWFHFIKLIWLLKFLSQNSY